MDILCSIWWTVGAYSRLVAPTLLSASKLSFAFLSAPLEKRQRQMFTLLATLSRPRTLTTSFAFGKFSGNPGSAAESVVVANAPNLCAQPILLAERAIHA